jgi:hypothetical protein
MALQAKGANVRQIALAATFYHWHNVVGIPQTASRPRAKTVVRKRPQSRRPAKPPYVVKLRNTI